MPRNRKCHKCRKEFKPHPAFRKKRYCSSWCEMESESLQTVAEFLSKESYESSWLPNANRA